MRIKKDAETGFLDELLTSAGNVLYFFSNDLVRHRIDRLEQYVFVNQLICYFLIFTRSETLQGAKFQVQQANHH